MEVNNRMEKYAILRAMIDSTPEEAINEVRRFVNNNIWYNVSSALETEHRIQSLQLIDYLNQVLFTNKFCLDVCVHNQYRKHELGEIDYKGDYNE